MKRVSVRTLVLLVELLVVLAAHQFLVWTPPACASAVWLDNEPLDPNMPDEPENPQPEMA